MPQTRVRSCTFKRPFESAEQAAQVIKAIRKTKALQGYSSMNAYKCPFCAYWHLGHSRNRERHD